MFGETTLSLNQSYVQIKIKCPLYLIGNLFFDDLCGLIESRDIRDIKYSQGTLNFLAPAITGIRLKQSEKASMAKFNAFKSKYKIETIACVVEI